MQNADKLLKDVIKKHGSECINEPGRLKSIILDYSKGNYKREVNLWFFVISENVLSDIASANNIEQILPWLSKRLQDNYTVEKESADWAITCWFDALNQKGFVIPPF